MKLTISRLVLFCLLLMLLFPVWTAGQNAQNLFEQGNQANSSGNYSAAIKIYNQIIATSGYSAGILSNLGNSYAQSGQTGKAILSYERALRITPSDSDIQGDLALIRKESGLFPKEHSWSERFFQLLDLNQWAISALSVLVILSMFQLLSFKIHFSTLVRRLTATSCFFLLLISITAAFYRHQQYHPSVVTKSDSRLLISPFNTAASTSSIQQGRLVYPKKKHGTFTYVTDETGRKGWVDSSKIEAVIIEEK